jgi:LacI family transcriptional regulator
MYKEHKIIARATIRDIALRAGVSIATVSKAMNGGKKGMSEETHKNILAVAKRLNYHPNLQARGLISDNPNSIGLIIPRTAQTIFSNPYFNDILKGISEKAKEANQYVVFSINEEAYGEIYYHHLAAGIIIFGHRIDDARIYEAWKAGVPIVLIPGFLGESEIPSLDVDNIDGAVQAMDYLAALGHRHIGFLNGPNHLKYHHVRLAGFRKGIKKNRLPLRNEYILEFDGTQEKCYEAMKKLLSLSAPPSAVLVHNDYTAIGAIQAAREMKFKIPEDISLVGFGDNPFASMISPTLTTIRAPYQELGYKAMEMALRLVHKNENIDQRHIVFPVELIVRESAGPPKKSKRI